MNTVERIRLSSNADARFRCRCALPARLRLRCMPSSAFGTKSVLSMSLFWCVGRDLALRSQDVLRATPAMRSRQRRRRCHQREHGGGDGGDRGGRGGFEGSLIPARRLGVALCARRSHHRQCRRRCDEALSPWRHSPVEGTPACPLPCISPAPATVYMYSYTVRPCSVQRK